MTDTAADVLARLAAAPVRAGTRALLDQDAAAIRDLLDDSGLTVSHDTIEAAWVGVAVTIGLFARSLAAGGTIDVVAVTLAAGRIQLALAELWSDE